MYEIKHVTPLFMKQLIASYKQDGISSNYEPEGLFYSCDKGTWVACDNRSGDAWTEEFDSEAACVAWLRDKFEMSDDDNDKGETRGGNMRIFDRDKLQEMTGIDLDTDKDIFILMQHTIGWLKDHNKNYTNAQYGRIEDLYYMLESVSEDYMNGVNGND